MATARLSSAGKIGGPRARVAGIVPLAVAHTTVTLRLICSHTKARKKPKVRPRAANSRFRLFGFRH
jgi:hypothetical protein